MELSEDKIWIDGCFDFAHHGHAGALLQARQLGNELFVGIHTDEDILVNKGPVVMKLEERVMAVDACKWSTQSVPGAPYVTDPKVMDQYGCKYVVHGDDITTDADGNDCYQIVKDMGRFVVVKRTPNISTTDLVGRMLDPTSRGHHLAREDEQFRAPEALERFNRYASGRDGKSKGSAVYTWSGTQLEQLVAPSEEISAKLKKKVFYADGAFDLFFVGHIEFLRLVRELADEQGASVVVGVSDDLTVNRAKGVNYPIMNQFERALCVLQCRYVDAVVLNAPWEESGEFYESLGVSKVLHGPTPLDNDDLHHYALAKSQDMYGEIPRHRYAEMSTRTIVDRVLKAKELYEERQRKKGYKSQHEEKLRDAELAFA
ncbi:ethanolamine-phosphate cytidylyltransferase [Trichomonascus vanleenenianus]|uniref:ethanolamine-phosphate cytidylyltransferase n=1 Tax=Trichomonascus vanleenenianus TaxID=2268995 RepID=UPI003ECB9970